MTLHFDTQPGSQYPPGTTADENGVNFCIFSRNAESVALRLYETSTCPEPFQIIQLDPNVNRTFFFWHIYVQELGAGIHYTWHVDGPKETRYTGFRFNPEHELLDPWAKAVSDDLWDRKKSLDDDRTLGRSMRAITTGTAAVTTGRKTSRSIMPYKTVSFMSFMSAASLFIPAQMLSTLAHSQVSLKNCLILKN